MPYLACFVFRETSFAIVILYFWTLQVTARPCQLSSLRLRLRLRVLMNRWLVHRSGRLRPPLVLHPRQQIVSCR
nr:hypothetical protein SHINE37_100225 [Rhizobiaceae bacterium]